MTEQFTISKENRKYGLIYGHQFPYKYEREDIFNFIDELLEDEEITNEN